METSNIPGDSNELSARAAWSVLALIIAGGVILRLPALHWLSGAAASADYSFHPDVNRFVLAAKDIRAPNPDGYPQGMTAQLFLVHLFTQRFTQIGFLPILQIITIFYAGMLILLTYVTARSWRMSRGPALLGAAFLSLAPLAVVESNFGTADVTAVAYFYATLLAGGQYLRSGKQLWFVILCVLTGMAIAVKFYIPLFAPLALVLAAQPKGERLAQTLGAIFIVAGSFEALSLFNYAPWDFRKLLWMLHHDNVSIGAAGTPPLKQLRLYSWGLISAVGIPVALLCVIGSAIGIVRWLRSRRELPVRLKAGLSVNNWRSLITPASLFIAAFSVHALLILTSGVHFERHMLVFVPAVCIAAAYVAFGLASARKWPVTACVVAVGMILSYQTYDAIAVESLYSTDIRSDLANWATQEAAQGRQVIDLADWLEVRGGTYSPHQNPFLLDPSAFVVTCDTEYAMFLGHTRAEEIYHGSSFNHGVEFFNGVFLGASDFGIVREFRSNPQGLELRLIDANIMAPLGSYVPRRCYALGRSETLPPEAQRAIRADAVRTRGGW